MIFKMFTKYVLALSLCFMGYSSSVMAEENSIAPEKRCAILLHGLGRSAWSMRKVAKHLKAENYIVWNHSYPSTKQPIQDLTIAIDDALLFCEEQNATEIYFVTHSLGGILVRQYFQNQVIENVKAVVMLAPPNHGSEVVDAYKDSWWFQWFTGPAGQQLGTEPTSIPNTLQPIPLNIGIIAGTKTSDPWFANLFAGDNDGKVSVNSAQLAEMKDFLTVKAGHTYIMSSKEVLNQISYFFENGNFKQQHRF
jgi:triacylglycerol lipase